jgi:hypothetical protein
MKVLSVSTSTLPILNDVIINRFIFLKGVHVELFPLPPKPSGCDSNSGLMTTGNPMTKSMWSGLRRTVP